MTGRIRRFVQLPLRDKVLLLQAAGLLVIIRVGLWALSFDRVKSLVDSIPAVFTQDSHERQQMGWAAQTAGAHLPGSYTCLVTGLTAAGLLRARGYAVTYRISVEDSDADTLRAHFWVESKGKPVIGGVEAERSAATFPPLDGKGV